MDAAAASSQSLQRFLETEDLSLLEKPLTFQKKNSFKNLQCCYGSLLCLASSGLSAFWLPIGKQMMFWLVICSGVQRFKARGSGSLTWTVGQQQVHTCSASSSR
jgi:hypothetical protein